MLWGSTSCRRLLKAMSGFPFMKAQEKEMKWNEMKHPLSGIHLEAHCSIELGEVHLFTVNTSRMNGFSFSFLFSFLFLVFPSQEDSLGKEILLSETQGQHKTFSGLKLFNYLKCIKQAAVLHLASCFIVWLYSWLEAENENHFPLLNFLVNSKRMVLVRQASLKKCMTTREISLQWFEKVECDLSPTELNKAPLTCTSFSHFYDRLPLIYVVSIMNN